MKGCLRFFLFRKLYGFPLPASEEKTVIFFLMIEEGPLSKTSKHCCLTIESGVFIRLFHQAISHIQENLENLSCLSSIIRFLPDYIS